MLLRNLSPTIYSGLVFSLVSTLPPVASIPPRGVQAPRGEPDARNASCRASSWAAVRKRTVGNLEEDRCSL